MADYSYYTRRIRDIREDNDLTQQQIAEILGTSQTMYARYERGANEFTNPAFNKTCRILSTLNRLSAWSYK